MGIATQILRLRNDRFSSVERLLAALEWQRSAYEISHMEYRGVAVTEAADLVLLNVAAHAADQLGDSPALSHSRRARATFRRKLRRSDSGQAHQQLYA
jgi:hypothetical protein